MFQPPLSAHAFPYLPFRSSSSARNSLSRGLLRGSILRVEGMLGSRFRSSHLRYGRSQRRSKKRKEYTNDASTSQFGQPPCKTNRNLETRVSAQLTHFFLLLLMSKVRVQVLRQTTPTTSKIPPPPPLFTRKEKKKRRGRDPPQP